MLNRFKDTFPSFQEFTDQVIAPVNITVGDVEWLKVNNATDKYYSTRLIYDVLYNQYAERVQYHTGDEFLGYFKNLFIQVVPTFYARVSNLVEDKLSQLRTNSNVGKGTKLTSESKRAISTEPYGNKDGAAGSVDNQAHNTYEMNTDTDNVVENALRLSRAKVSGEIVKFVASFSQLFTKTDVINEGTLNFTKSMVEYVDNIGKGILAIDEMLKHISGNPQSDAEIRLAINNLIKLAEGVDGVSVKNSEDIGNITVALEEILRSLPGGTASNPLATTSKLITDLTTEVANLKIETQSALSLGGKAVSDGKGHLDTPRFFEDLPVSFEGFTEKQKRESTLATLEDLETAVPKATGNYLGDSIGGINLLREFPDAITGDHVEVIKESADGITYQLAVKQADKSWKLGPARTVHIKGGSAASKDSIAKALGYEEAEITIPEIISSKVKTFISSSGGTIDISIAGYTPVAILAVGSEFKYSSGYDNLNYTYFSNTHAEIHTNYKPDVEHVTFNIVGNTIHIIRSGVFDNGNWYASVVIRYEKTTPEQTFITLRKPPKYIEIVKRGYRGTWSTDDKRNNFLNLSHGATISASAFANEPRLTQISLPYVNILRSDAFKDSPLTFISMPLVTEIETEAFLSVVNSPETKVVIPSKFNTTIYKNSIFGIGDWQHINFIWV